MLSSHDAEACITGLAKVMSLNATPMDWGKKHEAWMSHPSTTKRLNVLATLGGLADDDVQRLLRDYSGDEVEKYPLPNLTKANAKNQPVPQTAQTTSV